MIIVYNESTGEILDFLPGDTVLGGIAEGVGTLDMPDYDGDYSETYISEL